MAMKSNIGVFSAMQWLRWAKLSSVVLAALLVALSGGIQAKPGKGEDIPTVVLDGLYPQIGDVLYLSDSCPCGNLTRIFRVLLDEADGKARLVLLGQTEDFLQIDCLATTPDGKRLYMVKSSGARAARSRVPTRRKVTAQSAIWIWRQVPSTTRMGPIRRRGRRPI
jgi:hypothetical protein